jgi:hypothetical protein
MTDNYGFFEHLASEAHEEKVANRKAAAVAKKRVKDKFQNFLVTAQSYEDLLARSNLVEEEFDETVSSAVSEYGGDPEKVGRVVKQAFLGDVLHGIGQATQGLGNFLKQNPGAAGAAALGPAGIAGEQALQGGGGQSPHIPSPGQIPGEAMKGAEGLAGAIPGIFGKMIKGDKHLPEDDEKKDEEKGEKDEEKDDDKGNKPPWLKGESKVANPESINLEPNWDGVRAFLLNLAQTDPDKAQEIAATMGSEAPPELLGQDQGAIPEPIEGPPPYGGSAGTVMGSVHEARRPKMCPYHTEVTDISLASGEPAAGYNAMAQHAWGPQHCQSTDYEGRCNFKREMVTQAFWDDRAEKAEDRKRERDMQEQFQAEPEAIDSGEPAEIELEFETEPSLSDELSEAPSAVGEGVEVEDMAPVAASTRQSDAPLEVDSVTPPGEGLQTVEAMPEQRVGIHNGPSSLLGKYGVRVNGRHVGSEIDPTREFSPLGNWGDGQNQGVPVTLSHEDPDVLDLAKAAVESGNEGIERQEPYLSSVNKYSTVVEPPLTENLHKTLGALNAPTGLLVGTGNGLAGYRQAHQSLQPGQVEVRSWDPNHIDLVDHVAQTDDPTPVAQYLQGGRQGRVGEALKTIDVGQKEGPVPEMNKDKWDPFGGEADLPEGGEMDGSPNPTERKDILEPISPERSDDFLDGTRSVTETQDLPAANDDGYSTEKNVTQYNTDTWSENNGTAPVTSAIKHDINRNPLQAILESDFMPQSQVDSAISQYEQ